MVDLFYGSLILYAISGSLYLYALVLGPWLARPRRLLVRFIIIKIVIILVFVQGYFTPGVSPWASPLAHWVCKTDFQHFRTGLGGESEQQCVQMFLWSSAVNNLLYVVLYAYTLKAAYKWFRCHPDNDNKGIWFSRIVARENGYVLMQ